MACLAKQTVCKPLNEREHLFYKTLPKILTPYVPRYEGMYFDEFFFKKLKNEFSSIFLVKSKLSTAKQYITVVF